MAARDDAAMSVVAMIMVMSLMGGPLAATMVLPATAYVWVSGFGAQASTPAYTIALTSAGALVDGEKTFTVASATAGMPYKALAFTVDGQTLAHGASCEPSPGSVSVCRHGAGVEQSAMVTAGDTVSLAGVSSGDVLRVLDVTSNSVVLVLTIA